MNREDDDAITTIQSICQVSKQRARELWDAASHDSIERAIEIHLNCAEIICVGTEKVEKAGVRRLKTKSPQVSSIKRQATLDKFLGTSPIKNTSPKQRKIDSFFRKNDYENTIDGQYNSSGVPDTEAASVPVHKILRVVEQPATTMSLEAEKLMEKHHKFGTHPEFSWLVEFFVEITATTKRNSKLDALKRLFVRIIHTLGGIHAKSNRDDDAHILTCTFDLLVGKISSSNEDYNSIPLQVSGSTVSTALQVVTGISRTQMREAYRQIGDLGDVAAQSFVNTSIQKYFVGSDDAFLKKSLTISQVHEHLLSIALVPPGKGSQAARQNMIIRLLRSATTNQELRFLVRLLLGNMRLGATVKSVLAGLAMAVDDCCENASNSPNSVKVIQDLYGICPKISRICKALLEGGFDYAQKACTISVGCAVQPMLANPAHSMDEIQRFMTENEKALPAVAEWKYDGVRCQAHFDGKHILLFSRQLLENSEQYPDAIKYFDEAKKTTVYSFILDAEIVGVVTTPEGSFRLLPFQVLATRLNNRQEHDVKIRIYAFDLLYINGQSLLREPLYERQRQLRDSFDVTEGFGFASSTVFNLFDESKIKNALDVAVNGGAEGLMIKLLGAPQDYHLSLNRSLSYEAGKRSNLWLKVKRDYIAGYADTIDVVPIGAWFGNGRKAEKGFLSPILLAVYDEDEGAYRSISRCMSFTDAMYEAMREFYFRGTPYPKDLGSNNEQPNINGDDEEESDAGNESTVINTNSDSLTYEMESVVQEGGINCFSYRPSTSYIITNENPTIWFKPLEVFEVSYADLTLSRAHTAGAGIVDDPLGRGVALRFPRFKRRRPDKSVEQATTTEQIAQMFAQQVKVR